MDFVLQSTISRDKGPLCPIHVVTFTLISILVSDYIQKRRGQGTKAQGTNSIDQLAEALECQNSSSGQAYVVGGSAPSCL